MKFIDAMKNRYTAKKYDATKKLSCQQLDDLKEIVRLSPSSINSQPWLFHFVSNEKTKKELAAASLFNAEKILNCDTVVVFNSIDSVALFEEQINQHLPEGAINYYNTHLKNLPAADLKVWFDKQVYLSIGVFLSACAQMQIDATPMEGIEPEKYAHILNLEGYRSLVAVAIGHRAEDDKNHPSTNPKSRIQKDILIKTI